MNVKNLIGTVLDTIIRIVLIVVVVVYTYRYAMQAYDFGYRVFAEEPVSAADSAKAISISVAENATIEEIGGVLEEKGMIRDARLFYVQELLSSYHNKIKPGIYELRSDMTARDAGRHVCGSNRRRNGVFRKRRAGAIRRGRGF